MKKIECEGVGDNDGFFEMEVKASPINSALLYRFEVTYFDRLDWDRVDFEIIAKDYQEALIYVENKCPLSSRIEPHSDGEDSLEILEIGRVKLPIEI